MLALDGVDSLEVVLGEEDELIVMTSVRVIVWGGPSDGRTSGELVGGCWYINVSDAVQYDVGLGQSGRYIWKPGAGGEG